jgi:phage terminase small subunit
LSKRLIETEIGNIPRDEVFSRKEIKTFLAFFASSSRQNSINKLNMFCDNWQLTLNVKKTKTMVVQQNTSQVSPFIDFKGDVIQNVTEYKFLGCLF